MDAWIRNGLVLDDLEGWEEAIQCYDEVIEQYDEKDELDDTYFWAWDQKGRSLINLEEFKDALRIFD